ncbi:hypothetical protein CDD81_3030 [Ophiocordyceps australis]|uniref:Uncharacterized protein n=1 Tax=Ophiocordyceps australis TaxID=1399860 RepID=A0A2C5YK08_9HYPO|nr:hypothetical protein CDD81_3030 [Ophiocordyceps australis]
MGADLEPSPFSSAHLSSGAQSRILIWRSEVASAHDASSPPPMEPLSSSSASSSASSDPSSANPLPALPASPHARRRRQFSWRRLARRLSLRPLVGAASPSFYHFDDADLSPHVDPDCPHELVHTSMYRDLAPRTLDASPDALDSRRSSDENQRPTIRQRQDRLTRAARLLMHQHPQTTASAAP